MSDVCERAKWPLCALCRTRYSPGKYPYSCSDECYRETCRRRRHVIRLFRSGLSWHQIAGRYETSVTAVTRWAYFLTPPSVEASQ